MTRFLAICWKEFIQLRRDRPTFAMMVGLPVMQLLLFGYAINTDVRNIPTVVFDPDRSVESRGLVSRLEATGFYDVKGDVTGYDEILRAMREGRARVGIVFRPDYGERIRAGATGRVQLVIDGSDPQTVASALNTALTLSASLSSEITMSRIEAQGGHIGLSPVSMEPVTWFNPEQRTAIYIVPGLIGVILTMTMVLLTAMAIARERERGTLEQLIVSPIRSHELIAGKIVPYIAIGYLQMTLVLIVGRTVFGVPLVGSLPMLYAVSVVFIAACLAIGLEVTEIKRLYLTLGREIFRKKKVKVWEALFNEKPLEAGLQQVVGDVTLGDPAITTGLCIVTKRADTNSTWPLLNHPAGRFYAENCGILLRRAVRASAAAPVMFLPAQIEYAPGQWGTFVDGGISMSNNPAFQLFLIATLRGFPFRWPVGEQRLLLVSVGTGVWQWQIDAEAMARDKLWSWVAHLPGMFLQDASAQVELMLQYLSRSPTPWAIDSEIGDLTDDFLTAEPALTYLRYNVRLERAELERLDLADVARRVNALRSMSGSQNAPHLARIGEAAAAEQVREEHFPPAFDIK